MSSRFKPSQRLITMLTCAVTGALISCAGRIAWLASQEELYESRAKVVVGRSARTTEDGPFLSTVIEVLESEELFRRTAGHMKELRPELAPRSINIAASATEGSTMVTIRANGTDPNYVRLYLNALIDEHSSLQASLRESSANKIGQAFLQLVVNQQKSMEEAMERVESLRRDVESVSAKIDLERLPARLRKLRDERDDLRAAGKASDKTLEDEIRQIETQLSEYEKAASNLRLADGRLEAAKKAYHKLFEHAETFQSMWNSSYDYVAVFERATPAQPLPRITWSTLGVFYPGVGALTGFLVCLWRFRQPPERPGSAPC
jgi:uncharacterized protein involved in exopolysaccharide biosynthesis